MRRLLPLLLLILALGSGCTVVAGALRWLADVAESPAGEAAGAAVAHSVGLGWLWTALGGLGLTGAAAGEATRRARRNGTFVDTIAGVLDTLKATQPEAAKPVLSAISLAMAQAGRDGQFDAFLAKLGRNEAPVFSAATAGGVAQKTL